MRINLSFVTAVALLLTASPALGAGVSPFVAVVSPDNLPRDVRNAYNFTGVEAVYVMSTADAEAVNWHGYVWGPRGEPIVGSVSADLASDEVFAITDGRFLTVDMLAVADDALLQDLTDRALAGPCGQEPAMQGLVQGDLIASAIARLLTGFDSAELAVATARFGIDTEPATHLDARRTGTTAVSIIDPPSMFPPGWCGVNGENGGNGEGESGIIPLVVGAPGGTLGNQRAQGGIVVLGDDGTMMQPRFSHTGFELDLDTVGDDFGASVAIADFNQDNCPDVAVGVPGEDGDSMSDAGRVVVYEGTGCDPDGIPAALGTAWILEQDGLGRDQLDDRFGSALATGDFDGDGCPDLAVGAPGDSLLDEPRSGLVYVFTCAGPDLLNPREVLFPGVHLAVERQLDDRFGLTLAVGELNGDPACDDLVIGAPGSEVNGNPGAGRVYYFKGTCGAQPEVLREWDFRTATLPVAYEGFGGALATGDFDGDGDDDVAVGVRNASPFANRVGAGAVDVFQYESTVGLRIEADDFSGVVPEIVEYAGLGFGTALAAGDFDGDGDADLAIGAPGYTNTDDPLRATGRVYLAEGVSFGIPQAHSVIDSPSPETGQLFGASLSAGPYTTNECDDLVVGAPGHHDHGAALVYAGTAGGTLLENYPESSSPGLGGVARLGDRYGASLPGSPRYRRRLVIEVDSMHPGPVDPMFIDMTGGPQSNQAADEVSVASLLSSAGIDVMIVEDAQINNLPFLTDAALEIASDNERNLWLGAGDLWPIWFVHAERSADNYVARTLHYLTAEGEGRVAGAVYRFGITDANQAIGGGTTYAAARLMTQMIGFGLNLTQRHWDGNSFCANGSLMSNMSAYNGQWWLSGLSKWHLGNHADRFVRPGDFTWETQCDAASGCTDDSLPYPPWTIVLQPPTGGLCSSSSNGIPFAPTGPFF